MTAALEGGECSAARPGRTLPPGKTRYPFYRRLGGPQGRSGRTENLVPHRDSIPDRPASSSLAIPTELPELSQKCLKINYSSLLSYCPAIRRHIILANISVAKKTNLCLITAESFFYVPVPVQTPTRHPTAQSALTL